MSTAEPVSIQRSEADYSTAPNDTIYGSTPGGKKLFIIIIIVIILIVIYVYKITHIYILLIFVYMYIYKIKYKVS